MPGLDLDAAGVVEGRARAGNLNGGAA
jgi:hypothetical protein